MLKLLKSTIIVFIVLLNETSSMTQSFTSDRLLLAKNSYFRPLMVKTFEFVYISFPTYPIPKIKIESEQIGHEPCELAFPTMYDIEYPIDVRSLTNGKLVITFMVLKEIVNRHVLTLIVNPESCKFNSIVTMLNTTLPLNLDYKKSIILITGEDEFDIFVPGHARCTEGKICRLRYEESGKLMMATNLERPENAISWSINSLGENDFSKGYFYTVFTNNETFVKRLDDNLEVQYEKQLGETLLHSDIYGSINRCQSISKYELECELYNDELKLRATAIIDAQAYKNFLRRIKLFNLPDGSALILLILQVYTESSFDNKFSTYTTYVDLYGRSNGPVKFQDNICINFDEVKLVKIREKFFCISISCPDSIQTKCILYTA